MQKFETECTLPKSFSADLVRWVQEYNPSVVVALENLITNLKEVLLELKKGSTNNDVPIAASKAFAVAKQPSKTVDANLVQIRASNSEIERRISAFMEKKQAESNERNIRDFCNVLKPDPDEGCARTDAVFVAEYGCRSHVKGNDATRSLFERLKTVEERLLQLESSSPEYLDWQLPSSQKVGHSVENAGQRARRLENASPDELDGKIRELKKKLFEKRLKREHPG